MVGVLLPFVAVDSPAFGNLLVRPLARPVYLTVCYPIVGLAIETPVADRRIEGNAGSIEGNLPVDWRQRGDDLVTATAAAQVHDGRVTNGNIQSSLFEIIGNNFDELVSKHPSVSHVLSSLWRIFPSMA